MFLFFVFECVCTHITCACNEKKTLFLRRSYIIWTRWREITSRNVELFLVPLIPDNKIPFIVHGTSLIKSFFFYLLSFLQASDGEKSDQDLVVDDASEVCLFIIINVVFVYFPLRSLSSLVLIRIIHPEFYCAAAKIMRSIYLWKKKKL